MPILKASIKIYMSNRESESGYYVPVFFTDELLRSSVYDLADSPASGGYLPYLFVGYFTDEQKTHKWFFANARRHEEMREAIELYFKKKFDYTPGQIWFNTSKLMRKELRFDRLLLHSNLPNRKEAERLLRSVIKPEYLNDDFKIYQL